MAFDFVRLQNVINVIVSIIFLRCSMVCDPLVVNYKLVVDLLIARWKIDLLLEDVSNLVQLFGLAPIVKSACNINMVWTRMWPTAAWVSSSSNVVEHKHAKLSHRFLGRLTI